MSHFRKPLLHTKLYIMPNNLHMYFAVIAGVSSFAACIVILLTQPLHARFTMDADLCGIQKFHLKPVPRIGGVAVISGLLAVPVYIYFRYEDQVSGVYVNAIVFALISAAPAFAAGLAEDLTKSVSVRMRLIATFLSALLGSWLLGASLTRVDIVGFDFLLQFAPFSLVVTAIAVAGVANSVNIIDGFNGIAAGAVIVILSGIAFLANQVGDQLVFILSLAGIGAAMGMVVLNFPTGRLFMGDGGAYLLGFWVAEMAVLLVARNLQITAWQLLAICAYPVTEVMFSIYRRKFIRKVGPGTADRLHLHTLIYRRVVCRHIRDRKSRAWIRNAAVACLLVPWISVATWVSVTYGGTIARAFLIIFAQVFIYVAVYGRLVRGHWCFQPAVLLGLRRQTKVRPV
jgi:UDP-N-acetylmuramyl pentapeptide phosphotransferase/UDP-N-acetylglucosamine-1-phosphate transferase